MGGPMMSGPGMLLQVPIVPIADKLYTRISAQIYMEESDYDNFIDVILALSKQKKEA